ncbi:MAG: MBL fold metallo-hydrolase [Clostridia bacterium]|nr:MBL fold metallo-hydrolase [Clostridia bacterium]
MAELCALYSGSTGNSYFIGSKSAGVLVDIGRSARQTTNILKRCAIDPLAVSGILITHEHSDHVSGLRVFAAKYGIPVFASAGTLTALESMGILDGSFPAYTIEGTLQLGEMQISTFRTPHDCAESLGYRIRTADNKVVTVATDLGYVTPEIEENLLSADLTVLESNHDIGMLRTGPYPYALKRRILSDCGHLSNTACAELLPTLFENGTKRFMLAHLSRENNTPDIARQTAVCGMQMAGIEEGYILDVAPIENPDGRTIVF